MSHLSAFAPGRPASLQGAKELLKRRTGVHGRGLPYFAAEDNGGAALGYGYASAQRRRAANRNTAENSVYVRHDVIRRGVRCLLLAELLCRCEALGVRQMVATVGGSANLPSVRPHEALGFRLIGTLSRSAASMAGGPHRAAPVRARRGRPHGSDRV
jgi:L-amino acid N-acyltransferase YncA